jgi:hypothetical protein
MWRTKILNPGLLFLVSLPSKQFHRPTTGQAAGNFRWWLIWALAVHFGVLPFVFRPCFVSLLDIRTHIHTYSA